VVFSFTEKCTTSRPTESGRISGLVVHNDVMVEIERLLDRYETGSLTRRQLVAGLFAIAATAAPLLPAASLNHVTLSVSDVERSHQFYEKLFGMPVVSRQANGINLGAGPESFVGLYKMNGAPAIHHICLTAENFQVESAVKGLNDQGIKNSVRNRDGVKELYLQDPDGITVQVQGKDYRG
jgi:catechol 2,3-dioxygenase-like lactoylglutathione lyase family enzyme